MSNIKIGNTCERQVVEILRKRGYWVYNLPLKTGGQPVDVIGAKNNNNRDIIVLLDAKHVREESPSFPLVRVEPNQWASMGYMKNFAGLKNIGFAILFERTEEVYWLSYEFALDLKESGFKSVNLKSLPLFEEILNEYDNQQ